MLTRFRSFIRLAIFGALVCAIGMFSVTANAQQASGTGGTIGAACRVTSGPNTGKVGVYTEDGWCEGDWGGTECGADNAKCEDVASRGTGLGVIGVFDGSLAAVLKREGLAATAPEKRIIIVGAVRVSLDYANSLEIADRECRSWTVVPEDTVLSSEVLAVPAIECDRQSFPVVSLEVSRQPEAKGSPGSGPGPTVITTYRLSRFLTVPHLGVGDAGVISDEDWDRCVDIYLDCQIACQGGDRGEVFGSEASCLRHCDAVFKACTFDPF